MRVCRTLLSLLSSDLHSVSFFGHHAFITALVREHTRASTEPIRIFALKCLKTLRFSRRISAQESQRERAVLNFNLFPLTILSSYILFLYLILLENPHYDDNDDQVGHEEPIPSGGDGPIGTTEFLY